MGKKRILSAGGSRLQIDKGKSTGVLTELFINYVSLLFTIFYTGLLTFGADIYLHIITTSYIFNLCF